MTASCPPPSISEPSREELARALCLRLLTARARTRAELAGQLAKRGYPDDVSTRVLDRLADVGLVDDASFAEQWVHSRRANAGKGKRALAAELHTKGVDNDVITSVLGGINPAAERGRAEQERHDSHQGGKYLHGQQRGGTRARTSAVQIPASAEPQQRHS